MFRLTFKEAFVFCQKLRLNTERPNPQQRQLIFRFRQEGLGRIFSNFGTSPEELLKEEETWANGVQQVNYNLLG